jgi:hypothetical protein
MIETAGGFRVGDRILFDHFGHKGREGRIVKITKSAVHIEWTAPSSGVTRVVRVSTLSRPYSAWQQRPGEMWREIDCKNIVWLSRGPAPEEVSR